jgi:hypothetical protein
LFAVNKEAAFMNRYIIGGLLVTLATLVLATEPTTQVENDKSLQWIVNSLFTIVGLLGGWVLNNIQKALKDLQIADTILADKVHHIDVLVAGQYVKKDELEKLSFALFSKLDRIEAKLDSKADKD